MPEQNVQANLSQDEMRTLENLLKKVNNNPDLLNMINSQPESKKDKLKNGSMTTGGVQGVSNTNTNSITNKVISGATGNNNTHSSHGYKKDDILKRKRSMDRERALSQFNPNVNINHASGSSINHGFNKYEKYNKYESVPKNVPMNIKGRHEFKGNINNIIQQHGNAGHSKEK